MHSLTPTTLLAIMPKCEHPEKWVRPLNETMRRFEINTPLRQAAFLAQIAVESGQLNTLEENLNYAPGRLTAVWPKRFPDAEKARPYSRNPEKLANAVYANRLGNGDEASRDGYRFRGRGLIQITGRDNYAAIGKILEIDLINMPDTLFEPRYAALSAGAFWIMNNLNAHAHDIFEVTRRVSGSRDTAVTRKKFYDQAQEVFNVADTGGRAHADQDRTAHPARGAQGPAPQQAATEPWF